MERKVFFSKSKVVDKSSIYFILYTLSHQLLKVFGIFKLKLATRQ